MYSYQSLYLCTHRLRAFCYAAADPVSGRVDLVSPVCYHMTRSHMTAAVFTIGRDSTISSQTLLNKDQQFCESWRDAELEVSACVCCGWYDWRRPLSRSAALFATLWHCRELSDEQYAHHIQFEYWLLRRLTPAVTDRPPPVLRRQQSVPLVSSITQLFQRVWCSALAARR